MMLCKADFEDLFPDLFPPASAETGLRQAGSDRSLCALPDGLRASPPSFRAPDQAGAATGIALTAKSSLNRAQTVRDFADEGA